jgi:hypothetical protein
LGCNNLRRGHNIIRIRKVVMNTNGQNAIDTEQIQKGLAVLSSLALEEYHEDLDSILADTAQTEDERLLRVGRLMGVVLKEPFATGIDINPATSYTGAYRGWVLNGSAFAEAEKQATWQYEVLEALREENPEHPTVYALAERLQFEKGFFGCLANSTRKYICGDPALRQKIDTEVKAGQQGRVTVQLLTRGTASTIVATTLVQLVPWLAIAGAPIIAGLVLLIMSIGLDAFCDWSKQFEWFPTTKES